MQEMGKKQKIAKILVVFILIGTLFVMVLMFKKYNQSESNPVATTQKIDNTNSNEAPSQVVQLNCQNDWQEYHQDTLGIAFCYPIEWGTPSTDPIKNITLISNMKETFETQNIYYENALNIDFEKNNQIRIRIFNDQYNGKSQRDINEPHVYYESGATNDVASLKKGGSICDYKIEYDYKYNQEGKTNNLKTVYSECLNSVKTVLTRDKKFSRANRHVYISGYWDYQTYDIYDFTYDLRLLSFKKLSNGYFDNFMVSYKIDQVSETQEELETFDEFFNSKKTTKVKNGLPMTNRNQFDQERREFEQFVNTITAFKPIPKVQSEFKQVEGEDTNITTIRKYYWLIDSGKLDEAYVMYSDKAGTNFDKFKERYGSTYSVEPFNFKNIEKNRYEFHVKYQDHNSYEMEFRVIMDVDNDIVKTIFLEEYMTDVSKFGGMTAYSARRGNKNYVFLNKDEKEIIIDQGDARYDSDYKNISDVKYFSKPKFSPNGSYLTYTMSGWEWLIGYVYDIQKNKKIDGLLSDTVKSGFTSDENIFYACSSAGMGSSPGGEIYSVPGFKTEYDILKDPRSKYFLNIDCSFDENNNSIIFKLGDYYQEGTSIQSDKILELRYDLNTKKIE